MKRHHMTAAGPIPFTPEEDAARDAEEAGALAAKSVADHNRPLFADIVALEAPSGFTRRQREWLLAKSGDVPLKDSLAVIDVAIAGKRALLK